MDAGEQARARRWRAPLIAMSDEDVVDRTFGDVAIFVDEDDISKTPTMRFGTGMIVDRATRGFVLEQRIGRINGRGPEVNPQWHRRIVSRNGLRGVEHA